MQDKPMDIDSFMEALNKSSNKLTDWKKEPTVDDLIYDYNHASSAHSQQMGKIHDWLSKLNPKIDPKKRRKGRSNFVAKTIRKLAEWRYSSLASSILNEKNLFNVQASSPKYIDASFQNSLILNYQFNTLIDKVRFINSLVRTMVNEGTAIIRVGWDVEQQIKETEVPIYEYIQADPQSAQMVVQVMQQMQAEMQQSGEQDLLNTEVFKNIPEELQESIKGTLQYGTLVLAQNTGETQIVKDVVQTKNRPSVQVINNADLIIDPTCNGDFSRAKFVVYRYYTDMSTLNTINQKKPDTYQRLDDLDLDSGLSMEQLGKIPNEIFKDMVEGENLESSFKFKDDARKQIPVLEYWGYRDIDGNGIAQGFVATIADNKIIRLDRNPFPDGKLPFVVIPYLPVKGSVYGEPDAELIGDNQEIIQALTRSMIDINARSANAQVAIPKGYLDLVNLKKFNNGEDYQYNNIGMHPADAVFMHTANELPQSVLAFQQMQYAEAESITGVKSFSNGIDGNAYGQVVAGMSQALSAINQREGDIMFRISKGLEEVGNKILAMNMEWLDEEEVVALTQFEFISIKREDIKGDFFLSVRLKSNSESEGKAQQLAFMAQTLGAEADWGIRKIILQEIGTLYNLDTFVSALKDYEPQPDPIAQEKAQLENELLKTKLAKEQAEVEYFQARSAFIEAQIGNLQSQTDLNALDFMEQQEGVKHARQREIVQAQAQAQNEGKIASDLIKAQAQLHKSNLDNDTKRAIANASNTDKDKPNTRQKSKPTPQLINPEAHALPNGLFTADGLGNYVGNVGGSNI